MSYSKSILQLRVLTLLCHPITNMYLIDADVFLQEAYCPLADSSTEVPIVPPTQIYLSWFIAVGYWMLKNMFSVLGIALWREKMLPPNPLGYKLVEAV